MLNAYQLRFKYKNKYRLKVASFLGHPVMKNSKYMLSKIFLEFNVMSEVYCYVQLSTKKIICFNSYRFLLLLSNKIFHKTTWHQILTRVVIRKFAEKCY